MESTETHLIRTPLNANHKWSVFHEAAKTVDKIEWMVCLCFEIGQVTSAEGQEDSSEVEYLPFICLMWIQFEA